MQLRSGRAEEVGMSPHRAERVKALAAQWVEQGVTPSLAVVIARRGVIVLQEAFGKLTAEPDSPPLQLDTLFPLSSISKPVTATAAMILVEEGRLGLNRPVMEYIPEFVGEGKSAVTLHHLLTHTSGITDDVVNQHIQAKADAHAAVPVPEPTQHVKFARFLHYGYDAPLTHPPGKEMSYCNFNFDLVGEIVRRVSGQSLDEFGRTRIFAPLGMHDTSYVVAGEAADRVVKRPAWALAAEVDSPGMVQALPVVKELVGGLNSLERQLLPKPSSCVYSTAQDMAIFGQMFLNRGCYGDARILSPVTVAAMTRNQIPGISANVPFFNEFFPEASWGLGWNVCGDKRFPDEGSLHSPATFNHGGAGGTLLWVDPVRELVGVYFSVMLEVDANGRDIWPVDLFMNAVMASIVDG